MSLSCHNNNPVMEWRMTNEVIIFRLNDQLDPKPIWLQRDAWLKYKFLFHVINWARSVIMELYKEYWNSHTYFLMIPLRCRVIMHWYQSPRSGPKWQHIIGVLKSTQIQRKENYENIPLVRDECCTIGYPLKTVTIT